NRGKITVRDRASGTTQVLRVEAFVHEPAAADAPEPAPPGPAQSPPRHEVPDTPAYGPTTIVNPDSPAPPAHELHEPPPAEPPDPRGPEGSPGHPDGTEPAHRNLRRWLWVVAALAVLGAGIGVIVAVTSGSSPPSGQTGSSSPAGRPGV